MDTRPLVLHFGRLGDTVVLLPLIHALRKRFDAPVDLVYAGFAMRPVLEQLPDFGTLHLIRSRRDDYWSSPSQRRVLSALRKREPGPTWVCDDSRTDKARWFVKHAGIPSAFIIDERSYPLLPGEHLTDRWLRCAQLTPAQLQSANRVPSLVVAPEWRADLEQWLARRRLQHRPLVLVQGGNRNVRWLRSFSRAKNQKYWPVDRWARVIDQLAEAESGAAILLLGVPNEARLNDAILKLVRTNRAFNVARELPITRLLALQERAVGMISTDTGPAHTAAALGCPLVDLFGVEDPNLWEPRSATGAVQILVGQIDGRPSMLGIHPEEVMAAWTRLRLYTLEAGCANARTTVKWPGPMSFASCADSASAKAEFCSRTRLSAPYGPLKAGRVD